MKWSKHNKVEMNGQRKGGTLEDTGRVALRLVDSNE